MNPIAETASQEIIMPIPSPTLAKKDKLRVDPKTHCDWVFTLPPDHLRHRKILLLTIGGVGVHAVWTGPLGLYYSAYDASANL